MGAVTALRINLRILQFQVHAHFRNPFPVSGHDHDVTRLGSQGHDASGGLLRGSPMSRAAGRADQRDSQRQGSESEYVRLQRFAVRSGHFGLCVFVCGK